MLLCSISPRLVLQMYGKIWMPTWTAVSQLQDSHPRMAVSCYSIQGVMGHSKLLSEGKNATEAQAETTTATWYLPSHSDHEGRPSSCNSLVMVGALQSLLQYRRGSSVALRVYSAYLSSTDGTTIHSVCEKVWPFHFHSIARFSHHGIPVEGSYIDTLSTTVEARNGHPQKPCM